MGRGRDGRLDTRTRRSSRVTRPAIDAAWLEEELGELERLVADGETLELVSRLGAMIKEPRRVGVAVVEDRVG